MASIELDRVRKVYEGGVVALEGMSLDIADGEFVVFVGPSGCGKSTALKLVAGLEEVTSGQVFIGGPGRHRCGAEGPRHRHGVPELRALSAPDGAPEPRIRSPDAPRSGRRNRPARRLGGQDSGHPSVARSQAPAALGRAAAARGARPGHRARAPRLPYGRAALQPRRPAQGTHAGGDRRASQTASR